MRNVKQLLTHEDNFVRKFGKIFLDYFPNTEPQRILFSKSYDNIENPEHISVITLFFWSDQIMWASFEKKRYATHFGGSWNLPLFLGKFRIGEEIITLNLRTADEFMKTLQQYLRN